jgi:hypothetical protein
MAIRFDGGQVFRKIQWIAGASFGLALGSSLGSAQGAKADSTRGPRILVTAVGGPRTSLADDIADSLGAILRRRTPCTVLEVLTWRQVDAMSLIGPSPDTLTLNIADLRELAKSVAADYILDLRTASRDAARPRLIPTIIDQRSGAIRELPAVSRPAIATTPGQLADWVATDSLLRHRKPLLPIDRSARHLTCAAPDKRVMEAAAPPLHFMNSLAGELGR